MEKKEEISLQEQLKKKIPGVRVIEEMAPSMRGAYKKYLGRTRKEKEAFAKQEKTQGRGTKARKLMKLKRDR